MSEYTKVIGLRYPDVRCHASGLGYNDIIWISSDTTTIPIPQATLDADIASLDSGQLDSMFIPTGSGVLFPFVLNSSSVRNAYLSVYGDISSNQVGLVLFRDALIKTVSIAVSSVVGQSAPFYIRKNRNSSNIATVTLPSGEYKVVLPLNLNLLAEDEIAVYCGNTTVSRPVVLIELFWR